MRLTVLLLLLSISALGQEASDSLQAPSEPEWSAKNYSQEDKIFNRTVWTFADNPALAGFDRKLAVAYNFRMRNLAMGVPNEKGNLELAMMKHEALVDLPFGGPKQNWGMGLYYAYEKEFQQTYHRIQMARSLRIRLVKEHYLILGFSIGVQFAKLENQRQLTFGDMIDPRLGFVYRTNEVNRGDHRIQGYFNPGLRYYWRRFSFDYSLNIGPGDTWALAGMPTSSVRNKLKTGYHFNVGDGVTISPEFVADILTTYGHFYPNGYGTRLVVKPTNNFGLYSFYATITFKDMAFGQLGITDLNKLSFRAGYQLKDMLVIQIGLTSYLDKTMEKIGGIASVDAGIRYQIKAWNR